MITANDIVSRFEAELTEKIQLLNSALSFRIWSEVGEHKTEPRDGNTVPYAIEGVLMTQNSAMEANDLIIGANTLELRFMVPLYPPRTDATTPDNELDAVRLGQYAFPNTVIGVLSDYFCRARSFSDGSFTVGILGGVALPGDVDIRSYYGQSLPVTVNVIAKIAQNAVSSKDIHIYVDGVEIAKQVITPQRVSSMNDDVLTDKLVATSIATSSSFGVQVEFPATKNNVPSDYAVSYLLDGEGSNAAHFVDIDWGEGEERNYFMLISQANAAVTGVDMVGLVIQLKEVTKYTEFISVAPGYMVGAFITHESDMTELTFASDRQAKAFIGGEILTLSTTNTVPITPDDYELVTLADDGTPTYRIYIITSGAVEITELPDGVTFEPIYGGLNA